MKADYLERVEFRSKVESFYEYRKWIKEIDFFEIPNGWKFKPVPPFAGAVCRFGLQVGKVSYSIYLDCYDELGFVGEPYWEVFEIDGDVKRFGIKQQKELIDCISKDSESRGEA